MAAKRKTSRDGGTPTAQKQKGRWTKRSKGLNDEARLIKALAHPMRVTILELMSAGEWSPNELSKALEEGLSQVSYHIKVLKDFKMIEGTRTEPRRGAVEHFYRAIERPHVPAEVAREIPKVAQSVIGNGILEKIQKDIVTSLESGRFYERDDWHVGWYPADFDQKGCRDAEKLADKFIEDFSKIEAECANRRAKSKGEGEHIYTTAALMVFGSKEGPQIGIPRRQGKGKGKARKGAS